MRRLSFCAFVAVEAGPAKAAEKANDFSFKSRGSQLRKVGCGVVSLRIQMVFCLTYI